MRPRRLLARSAAACLCLAAFALLWSPRPALCDGASPAPAPESAQAKAGARLDEGIRLFRKDMFDEALAEFLEARRLYPFRSALFNAALCLEKLGRYDEAAESLELLLREIDDESTPDGARDKDRAQRRIIEVSRHVGTLQIDGAEPGSVISVDGKKRGEYPLVRSIRVSAGNHTVRVFKSGFEPLEERVDVAGESSVRVLAQLQPLARTGRVRIEEKNGYDVTVEIDGNPVGKAPWQGPLSPGAHVVRLRGEGDVGTAPVSLSVEADKTLTLSLGAEELASAVRVEPTPVNASVAIDKVTVGSGVWEGRLRPGKHTIEVAAPGFLAESRQVDLARGDRASVVRVELLRDPTSPFAPPGLRFFAEAETAPVLMWTLAGDVEQTCGAGCNSGVGLGGRALLRVGISGSLGLAGGVEIGSLGAFYHATGRRTRFAPVGREIPEIVAVDDSVGLRGGTAGLFAGLSLTLRTGLLLKVRVGAGVLIGSVSDTRTSTTGPRALTGSTVDFTGEKRSYLGGYVAPDVSLGLPLGRGFAASVGLQVFAAVASTPPSWGSDHLVVVSHPEGRRELGTFSETFADPIVGVCPGLGVSRTW